MDEKETHVVEDDLFTSVQADHTTLSTLSPPAHYIAIFPQHLTKSLTTLIIRENSLPHFSQSFSIFVSSSATSNPQPLFHIAREIPSFKHRQNLFDATTGQQLMTIRRNVGRLPRSFWFEDPTGAKVLDLQGDFFVPFTGAKSRAMFKNAAAPKGKDVDVEFS